ncbi:MAG: response regulator [Coleofasciculaceae cyanobacterium RL_1_1]|nr:response regulator [Coleofasciculaceae cyanobacterium RL_1_1]
MKTIVVIEDEQALLKNIVRILSAEGYNSIGAENGEAGIQLVRAHHPDLILCDIMMPGMNGYDVLTELQSTPETVLIPFIFLTAKTERADIRQGIELGADDYLTKPFDADELIGAIEARFRKDELQKERMLELNDELARLRQVLEAKDGLFDNLSQELRRPMSNINVALKMLSEKDTSESRERYIQILREEFTRELNLLDRVSEMKKLLTPENVSLLRQFNMLTQ